MSGGPTYNFQSGGAIYASGSGVKLEIHDTSFVSNNANYVSSLCPSKKFPELS
jgi:hypothetical protein